MKFFIERLAPFHETDTFVLNLQNKRAYYIRRSKILLWRSYAAWNSTSDAQQTLGFISSFLEIKLHSFQKSSSQLYSQGRIHYPLLHVCAPCLASKPKNRSATNFQPFLHSKIFLIRNKQLTNLLTQSKTFAKITEARSVCKTFSQA